jgi:hypothetical protein
MAGFWVLRHFSYVETFRRSIVPPSSGLKSYDTGFDLDRCHQYQKMKNTNITTIATNHLKIEVEPTAVFYDWLILNAPQIMGSVRYIYFVIEV